MASSAQRRYLGAATAEPSEVFCSRRFLRSLGRVDDDGACSQQGDGATLSLLTQRLGPESHFSQKRRMNRPGIGDCMPKAFPVEFRRDVVTVARKREATLTQIAKDFGVSEACLHRWLKLADIEDGVRPGVTTVEAAELRDARKRTRVLEQENEILRRAAAFFGRESLPK